MKKMFCLMMLAGATSLMGVTNCYLPLRDIIAPSAQVLTRAEIQNCERIYAYKTSIGWYGVNECDNFVCYHCGEFLGGNIITNFDGNVEGEEYGKQLIYFTGEPYDMTTSTNWYVEKVMGEKFVVHCYDNFRVYTSENTQYVFAEPVLVTDK